MKHLTILALLIQMCAGGLRAQERPVRMMSTGTMVATTLTLKPNTVTDEQVLTGTGNLGPFTFREFHADEPTPTPSSSCHTPLNFPVVAGGGAFRFEEGSLLLVRVKEGSLCIDLAAEMGKLRETYEITGGTGRFRGAKGTLTLTSTILPGVFNSSGTAVFLTSSAEIEGTISRAQ
jgi:hypothetical protein